LLEDSPIPADFDPPLLHRISENPLIPLGNPLRIQSTILEHAFLDRAYQVLDSVMPSLFYC